MAHLFQETIIDWTQWGQVFQSVPAFIKVIQRIFEQEHLPCRRISPLTPGSNAVFRVDNRVVKIYAPLSSALVSNDEFTIEVMSMLHASQLGIAAPKILAASSLQDRYLFRYIIMEYIEGREAKDILKTYSTSQKEKFVHEIKDAIDRMNIPMDSIFPAVDIKTKLLKNQRWNSLPQPVASQVKKAIEDMDMSERVYVHGDITGDNVLIQADGTMRILDFADSTLAPKEYEWPPILFDLFNFDPVMIWAFIGDQNVQSFTEKVWRGLLMHEYCHAFIMMICKRLLRCDVEEITDLKQIRDILARLLQGLRARKHVI